MPTAASSLGVRLAERLAAAEADGVPGARGGGARGVVEVEAALPVEGPVGTGPLALAMSSARTLGWGGALGGASTGTSQHRHAHEYILTYIPYIHIYIHTYIRT